ncbi:MAG: AAA family ATPase [Patescibacteria group bacterium]|nr:AAA family ATPase [Patescibacteria group bacterium]
MIIGITGTIGAGKGTVVEYLKSKGFAHYSSSGLLNKMLKERGQFIDRDAQATLAREIRAKDPAGMPKLTYEQMRKDAPKNAILEALHTVGEANFVRNVGGIILGVDADLKVRYGRISKRGSEKDNVTFEKFVEQAKREDDGTEESGHNICGVLKVADAVVYNNGTQEELFEQVEEALRKIQSKK